MRQKTIMVKGNYHLAEQITVAEFERINTDRIVLVVALRHPEIGIEVEETSNLDNRHREVFSILEQIQGEHDYLLAIEYGDSFNRTDVRVVEGCSLEVPWFYDMVKMIHKNAGHRIVDVWPKIEFVADNFKPIGWFIDGYLHSQEEAIEILNPRPDMLG